MSRTIQLLVGNMAEITTIDAYVEPDDDIETQMSQFFEQAGEEKIFVFTDIQGGSVNQKLLKYSERKKCGIDYRSEYTNSHTNYVCR